MTEKIREGVKLSWGTLMQGSLILATIVLSFSLVKSQANENAQDITETRISIKEHYTSDERKWDKTAEDIERNREDIHRIEVQNGRIEQMLAQIILRQDKAEANDIRIIEKLECLYNPEKSE